MSRVFLLLIVRACWVGISISLLISAVWITKITHNTYEFTELRAKEYQQQDHPIREHLFQPVEKDTETEEEGKDGWIEEENGLINAPLIDPDNFEPSLDRI